MMSYIIIPEGWVAGSKREVKHQAEYCDCNTNEQCLALAKLHGLCVYVDLSTCNKIYTTIL